MTKTTSEVISYPIVSEHALDIDPAYFELQRQGPVWIQLPYGEPCWLATSYEDAKAVHGDRRFGKEMGVHRDVPRLHDRAAINPSMLAMMDPPRHTRIRKLTAATFAKPRIRALSDWVDGFVAELLDQMAAGDATADFMDYSWTLPNHVVTGILGVPLDDVPMFRSWIDSMLSNTATMEQRIENHQQLEAYIRGLIDQRRADPTDDVLAELVHARDDDDRLTEDELVMLSISLFLGGFETTVAQLGSAMFTLLSQRDRWQELVDDPALLPAAMDELFRWIPSFRYGFPHVRWAIEDVELPSGKVIPAGDPILPERAVANRDPAAFPHADQIDFHREKPAPHLALGWGPHHCVGAHLAHLEIEVSLRRVLDRFPTLRLAVEPTDVEWSTTTMLRSPASLPVTW
ncbi:MAG TPA: cytochrome P450 [Acidimicrobiales bacterium]